MSLLFISVTSDGVCVYLKMIDQNSLCDLNASSDAIFLSFSLRYSKLIGFAMSFVVLVFNISFQQQPSVLVLLFSVLAFAIVIIVCGFSPFHFHHYFAFM